MIVVDLDKVLLEVCKGCNEEFSEEPCEPGFCMIRSAIEDVPALTLDDLRPKGRWRGITTSYGEKAVCSERGFDMFVNEPGNGLRNIEDLRFCPNCGADMRGHMSDGQRNQEG